MGGNRYMTIARELNERIGRGIYPVGEPLPPRLELAREFGVARATIDRCIEYLTSTGALTSRHGSGTFVNERSRTRRQVALIGLSVPAQQPGNQFQWHYFTYAELREKALREKLIKFEGLIWSRPEAEVIAEWIVPLRDKLPQVLVNRTEPGLPCVSTDHRGAYREITLERLRRFPGIRPFFLKLDRGSLVSRYRESGFVDACREMGCFYDLVYLPEAFEDKLATLRHHDWGDCSPLLLVSDSLLSTGAVMLWARERGLVWQRDLFYSDFDNDLPDYIWGIDVTSYIQADAQVMASAIDKMARLLDGNDPEPLHQLIFPERRPGQT